MLSDQDIVANTGWRDVDCAHANSKRCYESQRRYIDIRGPLRYANTFNAAITLLSRVVVPVNGIVTHRFDLKDVHEASNAALSGDALKVIVIA